MKQNKEKLLKVRIKINKMRQAKYYKKINKSRVLCPVSTN